MVIQQIPQRNAILHIYIYRYIHTFVIHSSPAIDLPPYPLIHSSSRIASYSNMRNPTTFVPFSIYWLQFRKQTIQVLNQIKNSREPFCISGSLISNTRNVNNSRSFCSLLTPVILLRCCYAGYCTSKFASFTTCRFPLYCSVISCDRISRKKY